MTPPGGIPKTSIYPSSAMDADESSLDQQVEAGVLLLDAGNTQGAQDVFKNMEACATANQNIRYELLARGLINLSEGHILAAQRNLQAIHEHPYAHRLLQVISHYDDQVVQLQTLHLLNNLVKEEQAAHPENSNLTNLQAFLEEAIQIYSSGKNLSLKMVFEQLEQAPHKVYKGMPQILEMLAEGLGKEILNTMGLSNRARAKALFTLIETKLLPQKRIGSAYLIAKMYQKDPEFGEQAIQYVSRFEGIIQDTRWTLTDFMDQGASYFAISLLSLGVGRYTSRGVWTLLTRNIEKVSWARRFAGLGLSLAASTATYFISEKALLAISGFDGKIWPASGTELAREMGADMIVMGLSNLMGGVFTWSTQRIFRPFSERLPRMVRFAGYTLRSPIRLATWGLTTSAHATLLYGTHRWEDNKGMIDRFRKGKPLRWLPQEWVEAEHNALEVLEAQRVLTKYLANSSRQTENVKGDEIYHQIHDLKRWMRELNGGIQSLDREEQILGIFWIARACGKLNESAQAHLLKWVREERYDKVNQYLFYHNIPLAISPEVKIFIPKLEAIPSPSIP